MILIALPSPPFGALSPLSTVLLSPQNSRGQEAPGDAPIEEEAI